MATSCRTIAGPARCVVIRQEVPAPVTRLTERVSPVRSGSLDEALWCSANTPSDPFWARSPGLQGPVCVRAARGPRSRLAKGSAQPCRCGAVGPARRTERSLAVCVLIEARESGRLRWPPRSARLHAAGSLRPHAPALRLPRQEGLPRHLGLLVRLPPRPARVAGAPGGAGGPRLHGHRGGDG